MMRTLTLTAVLLLTVLLTSAYAARPKGDTRYVGKTGQGKTIKLRVTSDRKGLQMSFAQKQTCNRGGSVSSTARFAKQRPTIKRDGRFSYSKTYTDLPPNKVFPKGFDETQRVAGSFSTSGRTVKGRIADSVVDPSGRRCKVVTRFTAKRR